MLALPRHKGPIRRFEPCSTPAARIGPSLAGRVRQVLQQGTWHGPTCPRACCASTPFACSGAFSGMVHPSSSAQGTSTREQPQQHASLTLGLSVLLRLPEQAAAPAHARLRACVLPDGPASTQGPRQECSSAQARVLGELPATEAPLTVQDHRQRPPGMPVLLRLHKARHMARSTHIQPSRTP